MSKEITNVSQENLAIPVPVGEYKVKRYIALMPGEEAVLTADQEAETDELKDKGLLEDTEDGVRNVSEVVLSFAVTRRVIVQMRQVVIAPGEAVVLTDEQAASPAVKELIDEGLVDDPDDEYAVEAGDGMYKTFKDALAAGETQFVLRSDLTEQVTLPAGKKYKIDLNGKTLKSGTTTTGVIENNGELVLTDEKGGGKVIATKNFAIISRSDSKLTIEKRDLYVEGVEGCVITGKNSNVSIAIKGGRYLATDNAPIMANGTVGCKGNKITVSGGEFEGRIKSAGYIACGIYAPNDDEIVVKGGTFNIVGGCGILARAGSVSVQGGTFECSGTAEGWVGDSKNKVPSSALVFDENAAYPGLTDESRILVGKGTFKSEADAITCIGGKRVTVSGGKFSSDPTEFLAEGKTATEKDGIWTVK